MVAKILLALAFMTSTACFAQSENREKIVATWDVSKFEILKTVNDSLAILKQLKDVSMIFTSDTLFIRKRKAGESDQFVKAGPYRLSEDGAKIFLKDHPAEIVTLNDSQLILKVGDEYIMHLVKRPASR